MKFIQLSSALLVTALLVSSACNSQKSSKIGAVKKLDNDVDSASYSLGVNIGEFVRAQGMDSLNYDVFVSALQSAVKEDSLLISNQQANMFLQQYVQKMVGKKADVNKQKGDKFLAENKGKEGVKTTQSGLQYKVLKEGTGAVPKATDTVTVHYTGKLIDGKVFDSSVERGQPATFPVNGVIEGWVEALQLMKEGAKYQLYIPSNLAYKERGAGQDIGPNETLIFDVELIAIGDSTKRR